MHRGSATDRTQRFRPPSLTIASPARVIALARGRGAARDLSASSGARAKGIIQQHWSWSRPSSETPGRGGQSASARGHRPTRNVRLVANALLCRRSRVAYELNRAARIPIRDCAYLAASRRVILFRRAAAAAAGFSREYRSSNRSSSSVCITVRTSRSARWRPGDPRRSQWRHL